MRLLLPVFLIAIATCLLGSALRQKDTFFRPEFYLLVTLYAYGTMGYIAYLYIGAGTFVFMIGYDDSTVNLAYVYTTLSFIAIYVGGKLYKERTLTFPVLKKLRAQNALVHIAVLSFVIGLFFNFYFFYKSGSLSGELKHSELLDVKSETSIFPYAPLVITSLSVIALYERRYLSWTMFGVFALLNFMGGSRRHVLLAFIAIFASKILRGMRPSKRLMFILFFVALTAGVIVGGTRGKAEFSQLGSFRILLALSEFMRPFGTLLFYLDKDDISYIWGQSFIEAIMMLPPQFLAPYKKPVALGLKFRDEIGDTGIFEDERVPGYGFFAVTELLVNFSGFGVPLMFFLLTVFVRKTSSYFIKTEFAFLNSILCTVMFTIGRNGFQNPLIYCLFVTIFALYILIGSKIVKGAIIGSR
jgi:hypothetical protein